MTSHAHKQHKHKQQKTLCGFKVLRYDATCQRRNLSKLFCRGKKNNKNFSKDTKALCYTAIHVVHRKPSNQGTELETVHFNAFQHRRHLCECSRRCHFLYTAHFPHAVKKNHSKIPVHEQRKKNNSHSRMLIHNPRQNQNEWLYVYNSKSNCICLAQVCKSNLPQRDLYSVRNQHLPSSQPPTRWGETKNLQPKKRNFYFKGVLL